MERMVRRTTVEVTIIMVNDLNNEADFQKEW